MRGAVIARLSRVPSIGQHGKDVALEAEAKDGFLVEVWVDRLLSSIVQAAILAPMAARILVVYGVVAGIKDKPVLPIRRHNLDAAAFVVYQSVRATMLARMLARPPELDNTTLVDELTDLVVRYLAEDAELERRGARVAAPVR